MLPQEPDYREFPSSFIFRGLWSIARNCWNDDPPMRPAAQEIWKELSEFSYDPRTQYGTLNFECHFCPRRKTDSKMKRRIYFFAFRGNDFSNRWRTEPLGSDSISRRDAKYHGRNGMVDMVPVLSRRLEKPSSFAKAVVSPASTTRLERYRVCGGSN